jgi:molybdate/tungstate transport system substrate-binding protein
MKLARPTLLAAAALALAAGCGGSRASQSHGAVSVLYAGSLVNLMEHDLGPAFTRASGDGFDGVGAGSNELVAQIKSGIRRGDVFISASPAANQLLTGAANGNWVSWYITFAQAPLVIGYNPHSRFAAQFRTRPWYRVITQPGIQVGRTDPVLDPKGKLSVKALTQASRQLGLPALARALPSFAVFPEEALVGRLEAGQLDAGFFYANEAREQHIPIVPLTATSKSAIYTVTILKDGPNPSGASAFAAFLLGPSGRAILLRHGLTVLQPKLTGPAAAVPASLHRLRGLD